MNYFKFPKQINELNLIASVEELLENADDRAVRNLVFPLRSLYMDNMCYPRAIGRIEMYIELKANEYSDEFERLIEGVYASIQ